MNNNSNKNVFLLCENPTKTITKGIVYPGIPVKKDEPLSQYNGSYTTSWVTCSVKDCTSFQILDDNGIVRRISRKRFKIQ